jgi:hypothetical protein
MYLFIYLLEKGLYSSIYIAVLEKTVESSLINIQMDAIILGSHPDSSD